MISIHTLQQTVIDALEDVKGQNIEVFDATPLTGMFDRVVMVSGTSNRQTRALAKNLHDKVKQAGGEVLGAEGEETGEWVLVDLGDIIVHIMQPDIRDYYRLEEIWGKYPIDWQALRVKPAPRRKATAKKPIIAKETAKKKASSQEKPEKPVAQKPAAKKAASKKPATQKPATKKTAAKKPAAKKPAAKKPVARKPAAKKPAKK